MRYYYKIDNPIYLRVHGYSVETESDPLMKKSSNSISWNRRTR